MRLTALTLILAASLASSAEARTFETLPNRAPASYAHADVLLRETLAVADRYWQRLGHTPACAPEVYVYDESGGAGAVAELFGCGVAFDRRFRDGTWREYTNKQLVLRDRRRALTKMCELAVHERGHNLGLEHTHTGIMAPTMDHVAPTECRQWAAHKLPRRNRDSRLRRR
jgi:hypothetical protein